MAGTLRPNPLAPGMNTGDQGSFHSRGAVSMPGKGNPLMPEKANDDLDDMAGDPSAQTGGPMSNDAQSGMQSQAQDYSQEGPGVMPQLLQQGAGLQARLKKLQTQQGRLEKIGNTLQGLVDLGDTVEVDDLVDAGAKFVDAGMSSRAVGLIYSQMPIDSQEALAAWVQQLQQHTQQLQQLNDMSLKMAGHDAAVNGMKLLLASKAQQNSAAMFQPQQGGGEPAGDDQDDEQDEDTGQQPTPSEQPEEEGSQ